MKAMGLALALAAFAGSAVAQDSAPPVQMGQVQSAILTLDTERLLSLIHI